VKEIDLRLKDSFESNMGVDKIAKLLGRDRSTIYHEKKRGTIKRLGYDFKEKEVYRANVAQADYEKQGRNKEALVKDRQR